MTHHIYSLSDPNTGQLRYIGKTINPEKRLRQHLSDKDDNPHKRNWIAKLKQQAQAPVMTILEEATDEDWVERERFWIRVLKPDLNTALGGQGNTLATLPEGTKKAMSAAHRQRHQQDPSLALKTAARMKGNTYGKGQPASEKQKQWTRENKPAAKKWLVKTPDGELVEVESLRPFCILHNLSQGTLSQTLTGERAHHKGYQLVGEIKE